VGWYLYLEEIKISLLRNEFSFLSRLFLKGLSYEN